jgi:hypothetical protein
MNIGVLVYGMYREFDIAFQSWDFIKKMNCDVFFSTWSTSKQINKRLNITVDETVTPQRVLSKVPNASLSILEDNLRSYTNPEKMIFHWKNCLELVKKSGKKYDYLILTRPDNYILFNLTVNELRNLSYENVIYGLDNIVDDGKEKFIQDIFFMGSYDSISKLINCVPSKSNSEGYNNIHNFLAKHILLNNLTVEKVEKISATTVRPNARELTLQEINISNIFKKAMEWGENQSQYYENNI